MSSLRGNLALLHLETIIHDQHELYVLCPICADARDVRRGRDGFVLRIGICVGPSLSLGVDVGWWSGRRVAFHST
jgi:hypothetical protein